MKQYKVTIAERADAPPVETVYSTLATAMRSAKGFRATLDPRQGGAVRVFDPDGREIQAWVEHPTGGSFIGAGGFHVLTDQVP